MSYIHPTVLWIIEEDRRSQLERDLRVVRTRRDWRERRVAGSGDSRLARLRRGLGSRLSRPQARPRPDIGRARSVPRE
jgi:hypothetical protein